MSSFLAQYDKLAFLQGSVHSLARSLFRERHASDEEGALARIEEIGRSLREGSDSVLREAAAELKLGWGETRNPRDRHRDTEIAFALVREASRRATGLFPYPEQLLAGLALVRGGIA